VKKKGEDQARLRGKSPKELFSQEILKSSGQRAQIGAEATVSQKDSKPLDKKTREHCKGRGTAKGGKGK